MDRLQLPSYTQNDVQVHNKSCHEKGAYKDLWSLDRASRLVCRGHDLYQQLLPHLQRCEKEAIQGVKALKALNENCEPSAGIKVRRKVLQWRTRQLETVKKCLKNWKPEMNSQVVQELRQCAIPFQAFRKAEERAQVGVFVPIAEEPEVKEASNVENEASWRRIVDRWMSTADDTDDDLSDAEDISETGSADDREKSQPDDYDNFGFDGPWYVMQGFVDKPSEGKPWLQRKLDPAVYPYGNSRLFPVVHWRMFGGFISWGFEAKDILTKSDMHWLKSKMKICGMSDSNNSWEGLAVNLKIPFIKSFYVGKSGRLWFSSHEPTSYFTSRSDFLKVSPISFEKKEPKLTTPVYFNDDWETLKENAIGVIVDDPEKTKRDRNDLQDIMVGLTEVSSRDELMSGNMSSVYRGQLMEQIQRVLDIVPWNYYANKNISRQRDPLPGRLRNSMHWWIDEDLTWDESQPDPPELTGPPREIAELWEQVEEVIEADDQETFDMSIDETVAWGELPLKVYTEELRTGKLDDNYFTRKSWIAIDTTLDEGDSATKQFPVDVVKNDEATAEQAARAEKRAHKKFSEAAKQIQRKALLKNIVERNELKLSKQQVLYYQEWGSRVQASWERFQKLCKTWTKGFKEPRPDDGNRIKVQAGFGLRDEMLHVRYSSDPFDEVSVLCKHWYSLYAPAPPRWHQEMQTFHCLRRFNPKGASQQRARLVTRYAQKHGVKMDVLCSIYAWMPRILAASQDFKFLCLNNKARKPTFTEEVNGKDYSSHVRSILKKAKRETTRKNAKNQTKTKSVKHASNEQHHGPAERNDNGHKTKSEESTQDEHRKNSQKPTEIKSSNAKRQSTAALGVSSKPEGNAANLRQVKTLPKGKSQCCSIL